MPRSKEPQIFGEILDWGECGIVHLGRIWTKPATMFQLRVASPFVNTEIITS